jgi:hypothetical protein
MRPHGWQMGFPHSPAFAQLIQALSFIKCGQLLLCFMERSPPSIIYSFLLPKGVYIFIKIGYPCLFCFMCIDDSS